MTFEWHSAWKMTCQKLRLEMHQIGWNGCIGNIPGLHGLQVTQRNAYPTTYILCIQQYVMVLDFYFFEYVWFDWHLVFFLAIYIYIFIYTFICMMSVKCLRGQKETPQCDGVPTKRGRIWMKSGKNLYSLKKKS